MNEIQVKYAVESETNSDSFETYSIVCFDSNGSLVFKFKDITVNKTKAYDFCDLLNRNKISPTHFSDVLEDYLYC